MAKVKLEIESDLGPAFSAFEKTDALIDQTRQNVVGFGKDSKQAFTSATNDVDKFEKEVKTGTEQVNELAKSTDAVGKSVNRIKEIKQEIKNLTSEAIRAGEGTKVFTENLRRVGELKDELKDINDAISAVAGNTGENLGRAIGEVTSLAATGFEAATAASALFGEQNEQVEKTLLKLQAIKSLANITKEFSGLGDKLTEIKLAFAPVTNAYTAANEGLKKFAKEGGFSLKGLASGTKNLFTGLGSGIKSFVTSGISGMKSLFAVIAANPLGIILTVVAGLIVTFVALKDKVKPIGQVFEFLGRVIDAALEPLKKLGELLGIIAGQQEKAAEAIVKSSQKQIEAIKEKYDFEIAFAEASGKKTEELENKKTEAVKKRAKQTIAALSLLKAYNGKLDDEQQKAFEEAQKEYVDAVKERLISQAKAETENRKKEEDERKKNLEKAKQAAEKRKQLEKDLIAALDDLAKKAAASEANQLEGEAKIKALQALALKEIDILRNTIIEKGKLLNKDFALTATQEEQFGILRLEINKKAAEDIIKLKADEAAKLASANKKRLDDELQFLDLQEKLTIAKIEGIKELPGLNEADLEVAKQKEILKIKRDAALKSEQIKIDQIRAEAEIASKADGADVERIKKQADLEVDLVKTNTENLVKTLNNEIEKLNAGPKFSLAKLLGLSDEDFKKVTEGISQLVGNIGQIISAGIEGQQALLDQQLAQNEEIKSAREQNITDLQAQLNQEIELQRQGLANNTDAIKEQLAAQQAAKAQDIQRDREIAAEKQQLARQQLVLDTITQGINLVTASTEIFKTYSKIPFIGIPLAIALIGTMLGVFATQKAKAFQLVSSGGGFKEGGYTGDMPTDKEAGAVHGQEFVIDAPTTKRRRKLLEGLHEDNSIKIHEGIMDLIKDKGIVLEPDLAVKLSDRKESVRSHEMKAYFSNDNSGLEKRLDKIEKHMGTIVKQNGDSDGVLPDGTYFKKVGNITKYYKKR